MFGDLFMNQWHAFVIRLAFSVARVDGAVNDAEKHAILRLTQLLRDGKAVDWQHKLILQGVNSRLLPEKDAAELAPQSQLQTVQWLHTVYWMLGICCADGPLNEAEMDWLRRLQAATASEQYLMMVLELFAWRENGKWGVADSDNQVDGMVVLNPNSGGWSLLREMDSQGVAACSMCYEQNRLPDGENAKFARCGACHMYLALSSRQADNVCCMTTRDFGPIPQASS
ncbi:hypothetical protein NXS98_06125 [Fontisphaera persica]|uniref:tellurite resistance TerB family protein n=1 Tax=Fontisphaera persica TaxID=2974023 RepID=UPI0024C017F7|nr:hypothetical protein [Fontisphaera persica]WCJ60701.1 hypothetical protein NXS98_06125 [Fontisphaera persica]